MKHKVKPLQSNTKHKNDLNLKLQELSI